MAETDDRVDLTDLDVIARYSLAVRTASVDRDEIIATLRADLDWLEGPRRRAPARAPDDEPSARKAPAPVRKAPAPAGKAPAARPVTKAAPKRAATKTAAKRTVTKTAAKRTATKATTKRAVVRNTAGRKTAAKKSTRRR